MSRTSIALTPADDEPEFIFRGRRQRASTLVEVLDTYLEDLQVRACPRHFRTVAARLRRVIGALDCDLVADLHTADLLRLRSRAKANGAANRTANLLVDSLRAMLAWAVEVGVLEATPLNRIRRLPETRDHQSFRRRALSDREIERFLAAAAEDDDENARLPRHAEAGRVPQLPLWLALLESGARWSELRRVRWRDLDLARGTMLLRAETTKSKRARAVPLRGALVECLQRVAAVHGEVLGRAPTDRDKVFLAPGGAPWSWATTNAMRILDRVLERAGITKIDEDGERVDIHALRHSFASRLARAGVGLLQAQRLLGHADPKTTATIYAHLETEDLRAAVEGLPPLPCMGSIAAPGPCAMHDTQLPGQVGE